MRILIIEDDAAIADAIVAALTRAGHAVDRLTSGRQADAALQAHPYDLIVLDLGLPEVDGVELLKRLRARADAVPVLVATAREALDERVRALDLGADDISSSPSRSASSKRACVRCCAGARRRACPSSGSGVCDSTCRGAARTSTTRRSSSRHASSACSRRWSRASTA